MYICTYIHLQIHLYLSIHIFFCMLISQYMHRQITIGKMSKLYIINIAHFSSICFSFSIFSIELINWAKFFRKAAVFTIYFWSNLKNVFLSWWMPLYKEFWLCVTEKFILMKTQHYLVWCWESLLMMVMCCFHLSFYMISVSVEHA